MKVISCDYCGVTNTTNVPAEGTLNDKILYRVKLKIIPYYKTSLDYKDKIDNMSMQVDLCEDCINKLLPFRK